MKVLLGLSGGVDSAVAAHLLQKMGYGVTGAYLDMGYGSGEDAKKVAESLGIDFISIDAHAELKTLVIEPFAQAYLKGETPNPCIICNPNVKFPALLRAADECGCDLVATGHYARVAKLGERYALLRGREENDQSYMLTGLTQKILSKCIFPLGALNKNQIRDIASELGLFVAAKPDSMEICFIPNGNHGEFIERMYGGLPQGDIVDEEGKILGKHKGIHHYTIGQRRGLGIAAGQRVFVSELDVERNRVILSHGDDLFVSEIFLPVINWISSEPIKDMMRGQVRIRHSKAAADADIIPEDSGLLIKFDKAVRAPTPGQMAAVYDNDVVLCAGRIEKISIGNR